VGSTEISCELLLERKKMAKGKTVTIQLMCVECEERNYTTAKNPTENKEKLELRKFCSRCRKHTPHKEIKISKTQK
jgi:large subunit ribosomal protein L33